MSTHHRAYHRLGTMSLDHGFALVRSGLSEIELFGERVGCGANSLRLKTFQKASHCHYPDCELTGEFFAIERNGSFTEKKPIPSPHPYAGRFHINLYGRNPDGTEVLFTCDHIVARCLGGRDDLSNTETMCAPHNSHKSKLESKLHQCMERARNYQGRIFIPSYRHENAGIGAIVSTACAASSPA